MKIKKKLLINSISISAFSILVILSLFYSFLFIVTPTYLNKIMNLEIELSVQNLIALFSAMIIGHIMQISSIFIKNRLIYRYKINASLDLYKSVFKLKYDSFINLEPTYIVERINSSVGAFAGYYFEALPGAITNIAILIVILIMIMPINPFISLLLFMIIPINYFGFYFLNKSLVVKSTEMNNVIPKEFKDLYQIISQVDFIKQNDDNDNILPIIKNHLHVIENLTKSVNNYANGAGKGIRALNTIIQNSILILLSYLMLAEKIGIGEIFFITIAFSYFIPAVNEIVSINVGLNNLKASKEFINNLISEEEHNGNTDIEELTKIYVEIEALKLNDNILIKDVKFEIKPGDIIGIAGQSGSGKTTLIKTLLKFRDEKNIKVNGIPITDLDNKSYRRLVSYYSQNPPIITGTVLENLNFGRKPVSDKDYAKVSFLSKFFATPEGLNTKVLENGNNLSGGDKQRIALSRYYFENSDLIVLDEPTNSLDKDTEAEILNDIMSNKRYKMLLLISHDPEHLKLCNKIIKLENKRLIVSDNT